jgi:hypothetical protein
VSDYERQQLAAQSWSAFCERLKQAGAQLLREDFPIGETDLAEGLRYLAHLVFASIQRNLDGADPAKPFLYLLCDERIKSGGDNPDNRYYVAAVSEAYEYLLTADFSGCSYYSIVALDRTEMTTGLTAEERAKRAAAARMDSDTLVCEHDGTVQVHLSKAKAGRNHIRIDERTNLIIIRCTIEMPDQGPVAVSLRRIDSQGPGPALTLEVVAQRLRSAAEHVLQTSSFFGGWTANFQSHVNQLPLGDQAYIHSTGGDPNILYYLSAWAVREGEALVIHLPEVPRCTAWNFQLCNVWMESLDYTEARIHLNGMTARSDRDGGVTIIVSGEDPKHANWLNTMGHATGTMCMRFTGAARPAVPQTSLTDIAAARELAGSLK